MKKAFRTVAAALLISALTSVTAMAGWTMATAAGGTARAQTAAAGSGALPVPSTGSGLMATTTVSVSATALMTAAGCS